MITFSTLARRADANYLATPAVAAYFDALEHESYYRALKTNEQRRNFHNQLVAILERFIDLTDTADGVAAVNQVMAARGDQPFQPNDKSPLASVRAQHPEGIELLGLQEPITFESLKDAYHIAARRHHPDTGGNHEAMIAVNGAFTLLHDLLREAMTKDAGNSPAGTGRSQIETCADCRYNCGELLLRVILDDWNIDTALIWLERILSPEWQQSRYARDEKQQLALTEPTGRLAARLAIAGRVPDAKRALGVAKTSLRLAKRKGLIYDGYLQSAEAVLSGSKRSRVVVSHPRPRMPCGSA